MGGAQHTGRPELMAGRAHSGRCGLCFTVGLLSHREPEEWMPKPGHWVQNPTGKAVDQTTFQAT